MCISATFLIISFIGLTFHSHGRSWLGVVYGAKRWFVYPPGYGPPAPTPPSPSMHSIASPDAAAAAADDDDDDNDGVRKGESWAELVTSMYGWYTKVLPFLTGLPLPSDWTERFIESETSSGSRGRERKSDDDNNNNTTNNNTNVDDDDDDDVSINIEKIFSC